MMSRKNLVDSVATEALEMRSEELRPPEPFVSRARRLIAEATPGPWTAADNPQPLPEWVGADTDVDHGIYKGDTDERILEYCHSGADRDLIAFAVNSLPALVDVVEAAETHILALAAYEEYDDEDLTEERAAFRWTEHTRARLRTALAALKVPHA